MAARKGTSNLEAVNVQVILRCRWEARVYYQLAPIISLRPPPSQHGQLADCLWVCRPVNKEEVANRTPQVIQVNEKQSEVLFYQNVAGKMIGRSFHFDKVQPRCHHQPMPPWKALSVELSVQHWDYVSAIHRPLVSNSISAVLRCRFTPRQTPLPPFSLVSSKGEKGPRFQ